MKQQDIGIDLGTTSIIIATEQQGVVFSQPSIGAIDTRTGEVIAVGDRALRMVGRAPSYIELVRPLRDGVIQDHRMTHELIVRFVNQVCRSRILRPRVSVCVPAAITGVEADAVVEAVMSAGAKQVFLVDEPVAAALGAGLDIRQPRGCMVIDIGGGSTDIAVISMGGKVRAASLPVAGNAFDSCIAQCVQQKYDLAIGPATAELLKKQVASCSDSDFEGVMEVRGHSWQTSLPARQLVYARDLYAPVRELVARIAAAAGRVPDRGAADRRWLDAAGAAGLPGRAAARQRRPGPRPAQLRGAGHRGQPFAGQAPDRRLPGRNAQGLAGQAVTPCAQKL